MRLALGTIIWYLVLVSFVFGKPRVNVHWGLLCLMIILIDSFMMVIIMYNVCEHICKTQRSFLKIDTQSQSV